MKLTASYILRLLKSPALYIGVAGCALIALWGIISEGNFTSAEAFVQYIRFTGTAQLFSDMMDFGTYRKLILIAACMPFTAAFCTEFKSGLSKQIILRSSQKNYILTHAVLNFLCTFFVSFLGIVLCVLALSLFFPLIGSLHNEYSDTFGRLLNNENTAWLFILLNPFLFGEPWSVVSFGSGDFGSVSRPVYRGMHSAYHELHYRACHYRSGLPSRPLEFIKRVCQHR